MRMPHVCVCGGGGGAREALIFEGANDMLEDNKRTKSSSILLLMPLCLSHWLYVCGTSADRHATSRRTRDDDIPSVARDNCRERDSNVSEKRRRVLCTLLCFHFADRLFSLLEMRILSPLFDLVKPIIQDVKRAVFLQFSACDVVMMRNEQTDEQGTDTSERVTRAQE